MNKYRELAAAIRKGHTMIGESRGEFLHHPMLSDEPCGCALGAAWVGSGKTVDEFWNKLGPMNALRLFANELGVSLTLVNEINHRHCGNGSRLAIANWLDTLEPERESDKAYAERKVSELMAIIKPEMVTEAEPMDYASEYQEWLMNNYPERVHNKDALILNFEDSYKFEEFLESRK